MEIRRSGKRWDLVDVDGEVLFAAGRTKRAAQYVQAELKNLGLVNVETLLAAYESGSREFRARMLALHGVMITGDIPSE